MSPGILWFERDLRLSDHPALTQAIAAGGPVIPLFIFEPLDIEGAGTAFQWRLGKSLLSLQRSIEAIGGQMVFRRGDALEVLETLVDAVDAKHVWKSESRHPNAVKRDVKITARLAKRGVELKNFPGRYLAPYEGLSPKTGGFFKVYTPFWRAFSALPEPETPPPPPTKWPAPPKWPYSENLQHITDDTISRGMHRGAAVLASCAGPVGEAAARRRLETFLDKSVAGYRNNRNRLDFEGVSRLSAYLATGEISPGRVWTATRAAVAAEPEKAAGAEIFLKEVVWREFAWNLVVYTPHILERNWRSEWDAFPWRDDNADAERWRRGETGVDLVDAAMRELYVSGVMHNRARMLVASYLTKHLMTDWRVGEAWFRDCLIDFDPASNAMGWQWTAGCGPDAAPFFRIFNPETQASKFDPELIYRKKWLPERFAQAGLFSARDSALGWRFFDAAPVRWQRSSTASATPPRPAQMISLSEGRSRALSAYQRVPKAKAYAAPISTKHHRLI